jgi:hypothetical protein
VHRSPAERHRASVERRANRAARKRAERAREAQRREDERARRWEQKQARWADGVEPCPACLPRHTCYLDDPDAMQCNEGTCTVCDEAAFAHVTSDPACRFHDAQLVDDALRGVRCHVCLPA